MVESNCTQQFNLFLETVRQGKINIISIVFTGKVVRKLIPDPMVQILLILYCLFRAWTAVKLTVR